MLLRLYADLLRTAWAIRVQLLWGLAILAAVAVVAGYAGKTSASKGCADAPHGVCQVDGKPVDLGIPPR